MDPSRNNLPLEFDINKGKPPMAMVFPSADNRIGEIPSNTATVEAVAAATAAASSTNTLMTNSQFNMAHMAPAHMEGPKPMNEGSSLAGGMPNMSTGMPNMSTGMPNMGANMGSTMVGPMGPMGPMGPNMMMGPMNLGQFAGLLGPMGPLGMMGPGPDGMTMGLLGHGPMGPPAVQKEVINLNSCILYPPHPEAPPHTVRERPPGCRTAFVGGLPENITEEILQEVFEKSGPIESIRLGKKNFAHIRFIKPESVEEAMYLSGYRMKIGNKDDKSNTGRIHVDYANARNDQYEYECEQRAVAREMRHQQQIHEERLRVPSPPPVAPFTIYDGNALLDVIKTDSGFMKACQQLVTWLNRGSVDKRSANLFYTLIQSSNSHVRRLVTEKQQHEEEVNQAKLLFKQRIQGIIVQLGQIESVFTSSLKQRNWDHFTKAQRKNIDTWFKQVKDIRQAQQAQFLNERSEMEMDMSDTETEDKEPSPKKKRKDLPFDGVAASMEAADQLMNGQLNTLKEENDSLKCQLEAYVNEAEMVKLEAKQTTDEMEKQIKSLQNALKGMQQQLISQQAQARAHENKSPATDHRKSSANSDRTGEVSRKDHEANEGEQSRPGMHSQDSMVSSSGIPLTEKEARILGLICCFLNVHPNGATVDYLWSYLSQFFQKIRPREIEDLLDRLPNLFQQELAGVGATLERRWRFIGYKKETV